MAYSSDPQNHLRNVVIFRDPDVEFILGEVGNVTGESGRVVVHRLAHENPSHVRPPLAVDRRMRIAFLIRILMMNAVRRHPENRPAFQSKRRANRSESTPPTSESYIPGA